MGLRYGSARTPSFGTPARAQMTHPNGRRRDPRLRLGLLVGSSAAIGACLADVAVRVVVAVIA